MMNFKVILRIIHKLNLLPSVCSYQPYAHYQKTVHKYPNLLNHKFDPDKPNPVMGYGYHLHSGWQILYLCAVLDLCGNVVLLWRIGADMPSSLVADAIPRDSETRKSNCGIAFHSYQGTQYNV